MLGSLILYLNPTFWLLLYNRLTKSPAPSSRALSSRLRISGFWAEADSVLGFLVTQKSVLMAGICPPFRG